MDHNEKTTLKDTILDCLKKQLTEYELLKSMYPNQGEIVLNEKSIISEINNFLEKKTTQIPNNLELKLNLLVNNFKLEVFIDLPSTYPKEWPDIYVRCNQINGNYETKLHSDLYKYIKDNYNQEVCLYTAISWLQENIDQFTFVTQESNPIADNEPELKTNEFARFWVYSHHIYNKRKREKIVKEARELRLTGFLLPGKPGIICIEGHHSDCSIWWKDIKAMAWQKITLRKTETFSSPEENFCNRKFTTFDEVNMSKKDLAKFMNELGLNNEFNDIFGLCS